MPNTTRINGTMSEAALDNVAYGRLLRKALPRRIRSEKENERRHTADEALREIAALAVGPILFPGLRVGALARFFHGGDFFKTNRNGAGRKFAAAMQGQQQRALQETQSQDQIGMKGRRHRITVVG